MELQELKAQNIDFKLKNEVLRKIILEFDVEQLD
jgi:hypothetical protein